MIGVLGSEPRRIAVLGTGGTIAGAGGGKAGANLEYVAGTVEIGELLQGIEAPDGYEITVEQIAQVDSKDMDFSIWHQLATRCSALLNSSDVAGVIITHGTDTIEETAFFLQSVLRPTTRPIVLTCAMRPATAVSPDGPQNLLDSIAVVTAPRATGVLVVCAGEIHDATAVRKAHPYRLNAFDSGEVGPVGYVEEGTVRFMRPASASLESLCDWHLVQGCDPARWPRVEIVSSHTGASGRLVDLLVEERRHGEGPVVEGLVIAATGNGSIHAHLEAAAIRAVDAGITVWRASRCLNGRIIPTLRDRIEDAGSLYPVKARVALMLTLMKARIGQ